MSVGLTLLILFIVWFVGNYVIEFIIHKYMELGIIANIPELLVGANISKWNLVFVLVVYVIIRIVILISKAKKTKKEYPELSLKECISREITRNK